MNIFRKFLDILVTMIYIVVFFALMFVMIVILKTDVVENTRDNFLMSILEESLLEYDVSENKNFNYLYYDSEISSLEKENIENTLEKLEYFHDEFIENKLKIVVSRDKVSTTAKLLFKNKARFETDEDNVRASYCPDYKLIVLDVYDLNTIYNIVEKKDVFIDDILNDSNDLNTSVLLHEIGHFLDDINENMLESDELFLDAYANEKDILFNESEVYYKSTIGEYIAESISRVLMINLGIMDDSKLLNSDTYVILNEYLNQYI